MERLIVGQHMGIYHIEVAQGIWRTKKLTDEDIDSYLAGRLLLPKRFLSNMSNSKPSSSENIVAQKVRILEKGYSLWLLADSGDSMIVVVREPEVILARHPC